MALRSPALSASRQALAAAVAEAAEHGRSRGALTRAGATAARAVAEAEAALGVAEAGVEQAKADAGDFLVAQALGVATKVPRTTVEARSILLTAEDDLVAAGSAQDALGNRTVALTNADLGLDRRLGEATRAVVLAETGPAALRLADELEQLQRDLLAKTALLRDMAADGAVPLVVAIGSSFGKPADDRVRSVLYRASRPSTEWIVRGYVGHLPGDHEGPAREWTAAVTALRTDASAPLPANRLVLS